MKKLIQYLTYSFVIFISAHVAIAQHTEGWIKYKIDFKSPFPDLLSDEKYSEIVAQEMGNINNLSQMYYFTPEQYFSKITLDKKNEFLLYDIKSKNVFSWEENSKTASVFDSRKTDDEFKSIIEIPTIDTIMGIPCKSIVVKSSENYIVAWYNEDYFPIDPALYSHHEYGYYNHILNKTKCIPIKYDIKGPLMHIVQTIVDYKLEPVDPALFIVPKFKKTLDGFEEQRKLKENAYK